MAITTYNGLKNTILDWIGQDTLSSKVASFVDIAEWRISRKIRIRAMESHTSTTITAGDTYLTLPDRFMGVRSVYIDGDPQYRLEFATPEQVNNVANTAGRPKFFYISGERMYFLNTNFLKFRPHKDRNFVPLSPNKRYSINQDAETQILAWAGNLTCSGAQFQGRVIASTV